MRQLDPECAADFQGLDDTFDTVLCVNVLEYVDDPAATVMTLQRTLKPGGTLIVLVPQGQRLFGTLDRTMGHKRRFQRAEADPLAAGGGFESGESPQLQQDRHAILVALQPRARQFAHQQGDVEDLRQDRVALAAHRWLLPWRGLSLILVARKER